MDHQLDLWQGQYHDLQAFPTDKPTSYGTERRSREAASTRTGLAVGTTDLRILKGTIRNGKKKLADERFWRAVVT